MVGNNEESRKKAISMLGGEGAVTAALEDKAKFLELRFRPESVFAHPAFGERHATPSLLLHVTTAQGPSGLVVKVAEFKGVIESTFQFNGLCDFQFLRDSGKRETKPNELCDYDNDDSDNNKGGNTPEPPSSSSSSAEPSERGGNSCNRDNDGLFIPPALFSRVDIPWDYEFKPNRPLRRKDSSSPHPSHKGSSSASSSAAAGMGHPTSGDDATESGLCAKDMSNDNATNEGRSIMYVNLSEVGDGPLPAKPPEKTAPIAEDYVWLIEPIKRLFAERPIWTAVALVDRIRSEYPATYTTITAGGWEAMLKRICTVAMNFAYRFISGPWRSTFVRYGFDPRKDSTSAAYQIFDLRFNKHPKAGSTAATVMQERPIGSGTEDNNNSGNDATTTTTTTIGTSQLRTLAAGASSTAPGERKRGLVNHPHRKRNITYDLVDFTLDRPDQRKQGTESDGGAGETVGDRVSEVLDGFKLRRAPDTLQKKYCIADVFNEYIEETVGDVLKGKFAERTFDVKSKFGWFTKAEFKSITATLKKMAQVLNASKQESAATVAQVDEFSPSYKVKVTPEMLPKQKDHHKNRSIRPPDAHPRRVVKRRKVAAAKGNGGGGEGGADEEEEEEVRVDGMSQDQKDKFIDGLVKEIGVEKDAHSSPVVRGRGRKRKAGKDGAGESCEEDDRIDVDESNSSNSSDSDSDSDDEEMYQVFEEDDDNMSK